MSYWISTKENPLESHYYDFETSLRVSTKANAQLHICADTRYQLYVNESLVCEGPCQGPSDLRYYESADLTPYLRKGENKLRARVLHVVGDEFISLFRRERPALWISGEITEGDETRSFGTDESWTCQRIDDIRLFRQGFLSLPHMEEHMASGERTSLAVTALYEPDLSRHGYNPYGLNELYVLEPRPIPQMYTHPERNMHTVRTGKGFIELDAGLYTTAKLSLRFKARKGASIRMIYAECYGEISAEHPHYPQKNVRDDMNAPGSTIIGIYDLLHGNGDEQTFSPFWYRTFRFIRLEFDPQDEFTLCDMTYAPYFYPLDEAGSFACSDERLNEMWRISRNTVLCCMHEMYVDCPYYEQQQYDMDSALEMLFTFRLGSDILMPRKSLIDLAHSQMPDGMLQANYPSTHNQIIPDFTLFWVLMVRDYLRYTGDTRTVRTLLGTVDKALEAFEVLKTEEGLIAPTKYWHFVDWVPAWERGVPTGGDEEPLTVACLMYAAALLAASEISGAIGNAARATEYLYRCKELCATVNRLCYDKQVGLYRNTPTRAEYAQHTTLWAVLSGAVEGKDAEALMDRTFLPEVKVEQCTFSMNYYLFRALEKTNRYTSYAPRLFEGWQKMLDLHCTSWCENPDDPRSECHGWSSAPAYEFSAMTLGVYPIKDGYTQVRIKPDTETHGLQWARGSIPTPHGVIRVEWEKQNGELSLHVAIPEGITAEVILPNGETKTQNVTDAHYQALL